MLMGRFKNFKQGCCAFLKSWDSGAQSCHSVEVLAKVCCVIWFCEILGKFVVFRVQSDACRSKNSPIPFHIAFVDGFLDYLHQKAVTLTKDEEFL